MYAPFEHLPASARVWVYQASRQLSDAECLKTSALMKDFLNAWDSHGSPLMGGFELKMKRFLILGADVDFHAPSGCSIDKSVAVLRQLEKELGISFFERSEVAFLDGNGQLFTVNFAQIKSKAAAGEIAPDAKVFNNAVQTKEELETAWALPAKSSWVGRFFG